jgi:hypothetical protein
VSNPSNRDEKISGMMVFLICTWQKFFYQALNGFYKYLLINEIIILNDAEKPLSTYLDINEYQKQILSKILRKGRGSDKFFGVSGNALTLCVAVVLYNGESSVVCPYITGKPNVALFRLALPQRINARSGKFLKPPKERTNFFKVY